MTDLIFPRSRAPVQSVFGRTGAVVAASGDYSASQITFTPSGFVSDTDTQAALATVIAAVTALANPGGDFKVSVRVATTANVNLSSAPSSIDGVTLASGDRVLVKDQSTGSQNGLYVFNGAGSAMTRATDANENSEVTAGLVVTSTEGTANADKLWELTTNDPITLGTTALTFTAFTGNVTSVFGQVGAVVESQFRLNTLTEDTSPDVSADYLMTYDVSAGGVKKVHLENLTDALMERIEDNLADGVIVSGFNVLAEYDDVANTFTWHNAERICSDADAATITFDLSDDHEDANAGAWHATAPITADRTLAISNAGIGAGNAPGKRFQIQLNYDDVGGHVVTWFPNLTWVNRYPPALTPVGGGSDTFEFLVTEIDEYGDPHLQGWILSTERGVMNNADAYATGLGTDLVAHWTFDEATSTRVDDVGTNDLTEHGTVASATGVIGDAASFPGTAFTDYLSSADSAEISMGDIDFTIACRINLASLPGGGSDHTPFGKGAEYAIAVERSGSHRVYFQVFNGVSSGTVYGPTVTTGQWYWVVGQHDAAANKIRISVNGGAWVEASYSSGVANSATGMLCGLSYPGLLDEAFIWKRLVRLDEIQSLDDPPTSTPLDSDPTPVLIDWSICEGDTITLHEAGGTFVLSHVNPIPLKTLLVPITSDNASGAMDWSNGVNVEWGPAGAPDVPADGDTIWLKFECVSTSLILGKEWHA